MKPITENTAISIGLVVTLVGGIFWISSMFALASNTAEKAAKLEQKQDVVASDIAEIKLDIAVIKEILKKK